MENKTIGALIILGMIAIISAATAAASFYSVGVSQVAILVNQQSGDFSGPIIGPTFGWKSPFFVNVVIISTSTQTISLVNTTKDQSQSNGIFVLSQDNLEIECDSEQTQCSTTTGSGSIPSRTISSYGTWTEKCNNYRR